jgi:hypothetical protein
MTTREQLRVLVDTLPESEVYAALRYLAYLSRQAEDPVAHALRNAPLDDEPLTAEDLASVEEAEADLRAGRTLSHEDFVRQLQGEP